MELLEKLIAGEYKDFIKEVQALKKPFKTSYEDISKEYDVEEHKVNDPAERKDQSVSRPVVDSAGNPVTDSDNQPKFQQGTEPVVRVGLPYQKIIVQRRVGFLLGNPVEYFLDDFDGENSVVENMFDVIRKDNKLEYRDRDIAEALFSEREVAEIWYASEDPEFWDNKTYSVTKTINSPARMKMMIASPSREDMLYPLFDDFGDMVCFIRQYTGSFEGKDTTISIIYTKETLYKLAEKGGDWVEMEGNKIVNAFGKIPVIYYRQDNAEWTDVQGLIDRQESVQSNLGDENDYFGKPILFTKGKITGFSNKKDAGKILEGDENTDVKFISWAHAPESIKLEIEQLTNGIYTFSQTPDISFENVKGMSAVSGISLKMMFIDAQMAARTKESIFGAGLQRRSNLLKWISGTVLDTASEKEAKQITLKPVFTPFMPNDLKEEIDVLVTGYQGGIMSQTTAVKRNSLVGDAENEMDLIKAEETVGESFAV